MTCIRDLFFFFALFVPIVAGPVFGQDSTLKPKDQVRVLISKTGFSEDNQLVLAVRIHAKISQALELFGEVEKPGANQIASEMPYQAFSLGSSYLIDEYTGERIPAAETLPKKPYFGPMSLVLKLSKGGWVELGVAFSKIPAPPKDSKGNPQPYKLRLHTPLAAEPVLVTFPAKS